MSAPRHFTEPCPLKGDCIYKVGSHDTRSGHYDKCSKLAERRARMDINGHNWARVAGTGNSSVHYWTSKNTIACITPPREQAVFRYKAPGMKKTCQRCLAKHPAEPGVN